LAALVLTWKELMILPSQEMLRNRLLQTLSAEDYALLRPHLVATTLRKSMILDEPDQPIEKVYFPDSGLGSIVAHSREGHESEVGMFGNDGMSGTGLLLAVDRTPHRVTIQADGMGHRISAEELRRACQRSVSLRDRLLQYVYVLSVQSSHTALSNATHSIEERLARWLLMSHDRTEGDEIALTHEFLSLMLAVRRPSVTTTLHVLEGLQLIRARRGVVVIRNRMGLEELASDAYGIPEDEYERVIGRLRHPLSSSGAAGDDNVHQIRPSHH
jgi:CRP-like cAMP-binding protein